MIPEIMCIRTTPDTNFDIDSATESDNCLLRFSAIPKLSYISNDLLSTDSLSRAAVIPSEYASLSEPIAHLMLMFVPISPKLNMRARATWKNPL